MLLGLSWPASLPYAASSKPEACLFVPTTAAQLSHRRLNGHTVNPTYAYAELIAGNGNIGATYYL